ncbi:MAG: DUF4342 domain-containing protein [Candidatus Bathyarchaeota archaeon]|nr:MAG: DUF4342 domain-containing protein [Candidatus Bathyarchaeota archaeon]
MAFCGKCGKELPESARYCPSCGTQAGEVLREEFSVSADNLVKSVKELLHEGNVRRIIITDEAGKTLLEMPVTVGVVGVILAPWLAALGAIAALATRCTITVERRE